MMLALRADLVVGDVKQLLEVSFGTGAAPGYRGWTTPDRSAPGHIGNPAAATAEKGAALFDAFASGVAEFLERAVAAGESRWDV
jgi:creatinine amidohydrolase